MVKKTIGIGIIGLGTVGQGVAHILQTQARRIEEKTGLRLVLKRVAVRSFVASATVLCARARTPCITAAVGGIR